MPRLPVRRRHRARGRPGGPDAGSAVVDFVLVGTLLLFVFLGVIQVGLVLYIRNTLAADAAEGARHAASLGVEPASGGPYALALVERTVPARKDTQCVGQAEAGPGGTPLVVVTCTAQIPLSLVPLGPTVGVTVRGHAVKEVP